MSQHTDTPDVDLAPAWPPPAGRSRAADRGGNVYGSRSRHSRAGGGTDLARRIARGAGELMVTFGLVVLLFAFYEVYGKAAAVDAHQKDLNSELTHTWTQSATAAGGGNTGPVLPAPGGPLGRLYIPALHLHWVVVEGVSLRDIQYAPGHYPGTALPGQIGNFSVAGHRIPSIFWDLQKMVPGQIIVMETRDTWYEYRVTQNEIVTPHSIEVIDPAPDQPGVAPSQAMMTLTTCNPKWNDYQRMAVHAVLIKTQATSAGPPVALGS